jgi:3-demethylubiquinone-9 3-methyltransferase
MLLCCGRLSERVQEDGTPQRTGDSMSALESFPRITPFLWFDSNAEEAVEFYLSVFKKFATSG